MISRRQFIRIIFFASFSTTLADRTELLETFCAEIKECDVNEYAYGRVCGVRQENGTYNYKIFNNRCELLKHGCKDEDKKNKAYGITNMGNCEEMSEGEDFGYPCADIKCSINEMDDKIVCGIKQHDEGFKVRLFLNKCDLWKFNCEKNETFFETEHYYCNKRALLDGRDERKEIANIKHDKVNLDRNETKWSKKVNKDPSDLNSILLIVHGPNVKNPNRSIDDFFLSTYGSPLPLLNVTNELNQTTRRMLIRNMGPITAFVPLRPASRPNDTSTTVDKYHLPLLRDCQHRCPMKCPETYEPLCAQHMGMEAMPTRMYMNHCYMDAAECAYFMKKKGGPTNPVQRVTAAFCLGFQYDSFLRIMPMIKTLQRLRRVKKGRKVIFKVRNFGHVSPLEKRKQNRGV